MISNFYMPTRIVAGQGALGEIGKLARDLKMSKVLVVSDPVLAKQSFHADAIAALMDAGVKSEQFNECGIDARCPHIDEQGERVRREQIDGVVCIGGGSVMCTRQGRCDRRDQQPPDGRVHGRGKVRPQGAADDHGSNHGGVRFGSVAMDHRQG